MNSPEAMVRSVAAGLSKAAAARRFNTTRKTVAKWVERFRTGGVDGLRDRSSRPLSLPSQTAPATCAVVEALRRQRCTGKQIAAEVGVSPATVSRILQRLGINKLSALQRAEPVRRYKREHPALQRGFTGLSTRVGDCRRSGAPYRNSPLRHLSEPPLN
jgi:transposase